VEKFCEFDALVEERLQTLDGTDTATKKALRRAFYSTYNCLETWCSTPVNAFPCFRTLCGLPTMIPVLEAEIGEVPPDKVMFALLNIKIIDSLLDSCRTASDLERSSVGTPSPLVLRSFNTNEFRATHAEYGDDFTKKIFLHLPSDSSVLPELSHYVQEDMKKNMLTRTRTHHLPAPVTISNDIVMDHLMQVQNMHHKLYKKHRTMARLFELSIVLCAWLKVSHAFPNKLCRAYLWPVSTQIHCNRVY
jgi:hypothetical protein